MGIEDHQADYKPNAWDNYSIYELGMWVHLLSKRATHRSDAKKAEKDLYDASNYLTMMKKKLDLITSDIAVDVEMGDLK